MIKIYKDSSANAIFIEDANGVQFLNSLQAVIDGNNIDIKDLARDLDIVTGEDYSAFVDESDVSYGGDAVAVSNALNAIFVSAGTSGAELPVITSNLSASITAGETLNYELTADYGVGYEWDLSAVSGVVNVEGNPRKLVGGTSLSVGTYNIPVSAINYNGADSETLVLTVASPPYSNTKSIDFVQQDYLSATASTLSPTLGRSSNGSGSSDAWSISLYFKMGSHTGAAKQTIFYFGDSDHDNGGHVWVYHKGSDGSVSLEYGSKNNYIRLLTPSSTLSSSAWTHVLITYNGGATGSSSGDLSDYYSRFGIFIDGASVSTTNQHANFGWSSGIGTDILQVGKRAGGNDWLKNGCRVDEISVWGSDQSGNVTAIYNSGTPFDLSTISPSPAHWWRMGDGDTFPTLADVGGTGGADFTMTNMTIADIVSDVP